MRVGRLWLKIVARASCPFGITISASLERAQLGRAPVDLDDLTELLAVAVDLDPLADANGCCACSDSPANRLPSVSCSERPMIAVSTADVVSSERRVHPAAAQHDQHRDHDEQALGDVAHDPAAARAGAAGATDQPVEQRTPLSRRPNASSSSSATTATSG